MGCTGVMVGSDLRFLTVGTVKRDAPTPDPATAAALITQRPSSFPLLHPGPPCSRTASEGGECHQPGEGQPPKTPWVST